MRRREQGAAALGALAILVYGAVIGLVYNRLSPHPLPLFASEEQLRPPAGSGVLYTDLVDGKAMFDAKSAVFVDARPTEEFALGHVPGALNVPSDALVQTYPRLAEQLLKAPAIVVYCDGLTCERSSSVANYLAARGHASVFLMFSGWEEWQAAGYPSEGSPQP